jgi:hypothetical protein
MTMRYAHLSPDVPRHAVKLLDGLGSSAAPAPNAGQQVGDKGRFGTYLLGTLGGGAGSRTLATGPSRNERRRGLTHQTNEMVWTGRSRSIPRRPT